MSKFSEFVTEQKLDARRILLVSSRLERLTREDRRAIAVIAAAGTKEGEKKKSRPKGRSGRAVTPRLIDDASAGKAVSGAAKTRLLRAVNALLARKKADPVDLRKLF